MFIAAKKFAQTNRVGKRLPGFAVLGVTYETSVDTAGKKPSK